MCSSRWSSLTDGRTGMGHEDILPAWHGMSQDIWTPIKHCAAQIMGHGLRTLTPCDTVSQRLARMGMCSAEAAHLVRRRVIPSVICVLPGAERVCYGALPRGPASPCQPLAHNGFVCGRQMGDGQGANELDRPTSTGAGPGPGKNIPTNLTGTAGARVTSGFAIHQPSLARADR